MTLGDPQSLTDLLRLTLRENHSRLTARFVYDTDGQEVEAVVESLWQELYRAELEAQQPPEAEGTQPLPGEEAELPEEDAAQEQPETPPADGTEPPADGTGEGEPTTGTEPEEPEIIYPPCPWEIRWYPARDRAELVEIELK